MEGKEGRFPSGSGCALGQLDSSSSCQFIQESAEMRGAASANRTLAIPNCMLARIVLIARRTMKILTAALLAFDAVILGYDLREIALFVSLRA